MKKLTTLSATILIVQMILLQSCKNIFNSDESSAKSSIVKNIAFLIILMLIGENISSQENSNNFDYSKCKIDLIDRKAHLRGKLYFITDSSVVIIPDNYGMYQTEIDTTWIVIVPVVRIKSIKVRTTGRAEGSFLIGSTTGISMGGIISFTEDDLLPGWFSMPAGEKAGNRVLIGLFPGAIISLFAHKKHDYYNIDGKMDNYIQFRDEIDKHCIKPFKVINSIAGNEIEIYGIK